MIGDGGSPCLHQREHNGDQGRPDEQTQEAEEISPLTAIETPLLPIWRLVPHL